MQVNLGILNMSASGAWYNSTAAAHNSWFCFL